MEEKQISHAGRWLRRRDAWIRMLVSNGFVKKNSKLVGVYIAMRMSAKRPFTYPSMKRMAGDLGISVRQVARGLADLEEEEFLDVTRNPGRTSTYRLNL